MTRGMGLHYIFYVSEYVDVGSGHVRKMDGQRALTEQIRRNLTNCLIKKYTEYHGELLRADSVGILFPSRMWGSSLAVSAFLQNLRVSKSAYVYAVTMGETLSADAVGTADIRMQTLSQVRDIFKQRGLGGDADIYIRCVDYRRSAGTTEERLLSSEEISDRIRDVMEGLLFYSTEDMTRRRLDCLPAKQTGAEPVRPDASESRQRRTGAKVVPMPAPRLKNIFLDDDLLSEVRICQAM